jgi:hypothetical protein
MTDNLQRRAENIETCMQATGYRITPDCSSAFCLGLFVGAESTTGGRFRVPSVSHHMHSPHLAHRSVIVELRSALERMQGQFKALLPLARAP